MSDDVKHITITEEEHKKILFGEFMPIIRLVGEDQNKNIQPQDILRLQGPDKIWTAKVLKAEGNTIKVAIYEYAKYQNTFIE